MSKCKVCKTKFEPRFFLQKTCINPSCLAEWSKVEREKKQKVKDKKTKQRLKTKSEYNKEAQIAINKYVRIRDSKKPCVSCDSVLSVEYGGTTDCGHYRSRGSASHLRFNLFNMAAQCSRCNRYLSGNVVEYRKELIKRIGLDRVEKIEQNNQPRIFTIEYLARIKQIFTKKARLYEKRFR